MLDTATLPDLKSIDALPSPTRLPLIGNLHQIDLEHFHEQLEQWCDELGPIFKIRMGTRDVVCIAVFELERDSPSIIYRHRPLPFATSGERMETNSSQGPERLE